MKTSISDTKIYREAVELAVKHDWFFKNFKQSPAYKEILEHVTQKEGEKYLQIILEDSPHYIEKMPQFRENDSLGNPSVYVYENAGLCSPTTLRYIKVASDIEKLYGNLDGANIIEIGCGYGGQSKILMDLFPIGSYTYVDLDSVLKLVEKYMSNFTVQPELIFLPFDKVGETSIEYDLVISNYSFSECTTEIQDLYIENIINKSDKGYMTCNFVSDLFRLKSYSQEDLRERIDKNIFIEEEKPLTHKDNCILCWDSNATN